MNRRACARVPGFYAIQLLGGDRAPQQLIIGPPFQLVFGYVCSVLTLAGVIFSLWGMLYLASRTLQARRWLATQAST